MRCWPKLGLLLASLAAAGPVVAHEQGDRAMGIVASLDADRIVIKAADGHTVEFAVTPETIFVRGERPTRREDVRIGERAVVHGKRRGDSLGAVRVKLPPVAPATP
jgi:hypothetical protein